LIDKSLLIRAESSVATRPLYQMLETVRAYAALELTAADDRDDALAALARYCAGEASLAAKGLVGPAQAEWLDRVHDDLESYRGALAWLLERDRRAEASDIAWNLMFFWLIRGHAAEGLWWYEQTLNLPSLPRAAESRALLGAAVMLYTQGEYGRAHTGATRAHALAHAAGDLEMIAQAQHLFGYIEYALGNMNAARDQFTHSVEGFRILAIPWGTGYSLSGLAAVALVTGDAGEAERRSRRPHRCFDTPVRGSRLWVGICAPSWRCGAGTPIRRSCWCVKVSHPFGNSMTSSRSSTR
jgi:hypothetical protein